MDLSSLNLSGLNDLLAQVDREIKNRQSQEVASAREKILAIAREVGMPVEALMTIPSKGVPRKGKGIPVAAKYADPNDPSKQWTGRGRKPGWVNELLAGGKKLEDLEIKQG